MLGTATAPPTWRSRLASLGPSVPWREIGPLLQVAIRYWSSDRAPRLGAALAYYVALSLAPTLVIMVAVAESAFNEQAVRGSLIWQIQNTVGADGARLIQTIVE